MTFKPLFVFHLDFIPRRIAAHYIKSTISKDFGKLYAPVEEAVGTCHFVHFMLERIGKHLQTFHFFGCVIKILYLLQRIINGTGIGNVKRCEYICLFVKLRNKIFIFELFEETISVNVASTPQTFYTWRLHQFFPLRLFSKFLQKRFFWQGTNFFYFSGKSYLLAVNALYGNVSAKQCHRISYRLAVLNQSHIFKSFLIQVYNLFLCFFILGRESLFRYTIEQCVEIGNTYHRVSATYMMVEE